MSQTLQISFGGYQGPRSVNTRGAESFCTALRDQLGDAVEVVLRGNIIDEGRNAAELMPMTERGALDACYFASSYLAERVPSLALFDMHFAVPDRARAFALLDGALGDRLAEEVARHTGFAVLGWWDNGLRHISSAGPALRRPEQGRGVVLRTLNNADHRRCFEALGFETRVTDVKDLPGVVARGEVDAQENPLTNIYHFGMHRAHPVITLTGHLLGICPVLFNRERFEAWPEEVRRAVRHAMREATRVQRAAALNDDEICAAKLDAEGAALVALSAEERAAWRAAVRPETDRIRGRIAPELLAMLAAEPA